MKAEDLQKELAALATPEVETSMRRFFKTGPGQYGEGDHFRGIKVPVTRKAAAGYRALGFPEVKRLLASKYHEDRLAALVILAHQFQRGDEALRGKIFRLYIGGAKWINNWDLVDVSAPYILGGWLEDKDRTPLYALAESRNLWERRMAMLATQHFTRKGDFGDALRIATLLLEDREDLIHKAVGWMLREVGNRDRRKEEAFLKPHYLSMPRTMLRYAIEKFPEARRKAYLKGTV